MKKLIALTLAGAMLFSMPVMAAGSPSPVTAAVASASKETPSEPAAVPNTAVAATPVAAVVASSIPASVIAAAGEEGKTVGEYMNNAVVTVPGLENATPLGQGGHVIINGAPSNQVFSVLKPALANVNSAKAYAAALGGRVLSVARISASVANFNTATVNFYMPGVKAGQNIKVFQMANGQWAELTVSEIRADHVVVDMKSLGTLAFIEVP